MEGIYVVKYNISTVVGEEAGGLNESIEVHPAVKE